MIEKDGENCRVTDSTEQKPEEDGAVLGSSVEKKGDYWRVRSSAVNHL